MLVISVPRHRSAAGGETWGQRETRPQGPSVRPRAARPAGTSSGPSEKSPGVLAAEARPEVSENSPEEPATEPVMHLAMRTRCEGPGPEPVTAGHGTCRVVARDGARQASGDAEHWWCSPVRLPCEQRGRDPSVSRVSRRLGPSLACLLASSALLAACAHQDRPDPARVDAPSGPQAFEDCELGDGSSVPAAFPKGSIAPPGASEHRFVCALSAQLDALGEPSLFPVAPASEVYRVLWLRSDGHPVSVRFEREGPVAQVRGAQSAGKGLSPSGELLEESAIALSQDGTRDILARVESARFWSPPPAPTDTSVPDRGSTWIFEGVRAGSYRLRVFQRESLAKDAGYTSLAHALIRASGLHIQGAVY